MPVLTWEQVAAVAIKAGWPPGDAVVAVSITEPESGRDSTIIQQGEPYATTGWGLWQITPGNSVPQFGIDRQLLNALNNARAGHYKWAAAGSFEPWTTWVNGLNRPYLPEAEAAVQAVTHLSRKQLDQLVREAEKGGGAAAGNAPPMTSWAHQIKETRGHFDHATGHLHSSAVALAHLHPRFTPPAVRPAGPGGVVAPIERYRNGR